MPQQTHGATPQPSRTQTTSLTVKTHVKAGGARYNHNATLVRASQDADATLVRAKGQAARLTVKTHVKAGSTRGLSTNHNETLVRVRRQPA